MRPPHGVTGLLAIDAPSSRPFLAVLVAAALTVVAGLLMPKVDTAVGGEPEPTDVEPAST